MLGVMKKELSYWYYINWKMRVLDCTYIFFAEQGKQLLIFPSINYYKPILRYINLWIWSFIQITVHKSVAVFMELLTKNNRLRKSHATHNLPEIPVCQINYNIFSTVKIATLTLFFPTKPSMAFYIVWFNSYSVLRAESADRIINDKRVGDKISANDKRSNCKR